MKDGKQYQVIGQFEDIDRADPLDLTSMFVKNNKGELIQMDNVVKVDEQSNPLNYSITIVICLLPYQQPLAPGKSISDGIQAMDEIKLKH